MKKSVIALALIGAFSGAAYAQSNVTVYGILDVGYQWTDQPTAMTNPTRVQLESVNGINGSIQSGNRLGFRGTEALGGGLNAIFDIEAGFNIDSGTSAQGGRLFGRQAYAGLSGNWGAVVAGRLATFSSGTGDFDMIGRVDPFSTGFNLAGAQNTFYSMNSVRADNAVAYVSPVFSGFKAGVGYSTRYDGAETAPSSSNTTVFFAGANWTYGPFFAAATYDAINYPSAGCTPAPTNTCGNPTQKHIQVGGTWDIASFRLHAAWADQSNISAVAAPTYGTGNIVLSPVPFDNNAWLLGVTWTATDAIKVFGSWQSASADGQTVGTGPNRVNYDPDYNVWGIGATYNLSRRTNLYTAYAQRNANGTLLDNSFNTKQFSLGVRHLF